MARTRLSLRGDRRLGRQLAELRAQADDIVTDTLTGWGSDVRDTAKSLAPRRTGRLRRGITMRVNERRGRVQVGTWRPFYAHFVEHGTSDTPAQPFLWPAAQRHDVVGYVRTAVAKRLP